MTIEVYDAPNALVIKEASPEWVATAMLFMKLVAVIPPERSVLLSNQNGKVHTLYTSTNPNSRVIDTIGKIEIREIGKNPELIHLNEDNPAYVWGNTDENGIAVKKIIRYRPAQNG